MQCCLLAGVILRQDQHVASFLMAGFKTAGCILTGAALAGIVVGLACFQTFVLTPGGSSLLPYYLLGFPPERFCIEQSTDGC